MPGYLSANINGCVSLLIHHSKTQKYMTGEGLVSLPCITYRQAQANKIEKVRRKEKRNMDAYSFGWIESSVHTNPIYILCFYFIFSFTCKISDFSRIFQTAIGLCHGLWNECVCSVTFSHQPVCSCPFPLPRSPLAE